MARTQTRVTRETQRTDVIYVCPNNGGAFVTPDGIGRYWYYRSYPQEYDWPKSEWVPDNLTDEEAAIWVAEAQHGELPHVYLEEEPND
jgi:hypothetical protein